MSTTPPTIADLNDQIVASMESRLGQAIPLLPKGFIRVLSVVLASLFVILYKFAAYNALQPFVKYADTSETTYNGTTLIPLLELGRELGVDDPTEATKAELNITVVATAATTLGAQEQLVGATNGFVYLTKTSTELVIGDNTVEVIAASDQAGGNGAGADGNLVAGDTLVFVTPLNGVNSVATVESQLVTAADAETWETYRQRILDRKQKQPQGGAYADYQQWGEAVAGILSIYPYTSSYPGQVDLYVEATVASSGSDDGIPTTAQLEAVLAAVEYDEAGLATRRPAGAAVNAYAITRKGFTVAVSGIADVSDVSSVQTDIESALTQYFANAEPYIPGLSVPPRKDRITSGGVSGVVDDIVSAAGGYYASVSLLVEGEATTVYTLGIGEKAKLTEVTY